MEIKKRAFEKGCLRACLNFFAGIQIAKYHKRQKYCRV
jgi:hypothetical protein